jgi:outer membrane protein
MTRTAILRLLTIPLLVAAAAGPAAAQAQRLTFSDALRLATERSEAVEIARAGQARASAGIEQAASQRRPQVSFSGAYTRTLASEFSRALETTGPVCEPFSVDATRPLGDRVTEIERAATCGSLVGGGFNFADLPFGQRNSYQLGLTFSQALYTGGRIAALETQAGIVASAAALTVSLTEAQLSLDVARAYYGAALTDRLLAIAESVHAQAAAAYEQTRLAFDAGRQPEFELLRAQVARDNQRPTVIRRRADRDIAFLRLRQLLELPAGTPLELDVDLEAADLPAPAPFAQALAAARAGAATEVLAVRYSEAAVASRETAVALAKSERLPSISLGSAVAGVGYPSSGLVPSFGDFRTNWTLAATIQIPLLTGGRLRSSERAAAADLVQARAELKQSRELAELTTATALEDLAAAEAAWDASAGTVQQARRAYEIAELRNREGLSTQLELADSRVSLEIAQANRAQAGHDVQLARARVALVPALPAGSR